MNIHTLVNHRDIQEWVNERHGQPAFQRVPDAYGDVKAELALNFPRRAKPRDMLKSMATSPMGGVSPVSWTAWLAELDRQQLALRVSDKGEPDFEFVGRSGLN